MDWKTFVTKILSESAWPAVVLVCILLLRRPLSHLLPLLRTAKYKDFELHFGQKLEELERRADAAKLPEPEPRPGIRDVPASLGDRMALIAAISPRAGIVEAWRHVDRALRSFMSSADKPAHLPPGRLVAIMYKEGMLDAETIALIDELRQLRNEAAHADQFDLGPDQAQHYTDLAQRLAATLKLYTESPSGSSSQEEE